MIYFVDMKSKYGFSDGDAVPPGIEKYRDAYITTINTFAEAFGSTIRAEAYDRPGEYNWCFIRFKDTAKPDDERTITKLDAETIYAIQAAYDLDVDQYIEVTCELNEEALEYAIEDYMDEAVDFYINKAKEEQDD